MGLYCAWRWFVHASVRARWIAAAVLIALLASAIPAPAQAQTWQPRMWFFQGGWAEQHTRTWTVGVLWPWRSSWLWAGGAWSGYWEAALGRWSTDGTDGRDRAWVTQFGVTPVFRYQKDRSPWFFEAGVGVTFIAPIYRNPRKRFSTTFNFIEQLAVGRHFGGQGEHQLSLRVQHVSNGGIRHPNPGEDFIQLRYTRAF